MKRTIFIILLFFLILPLGLVTINVAKGSTSNTEMERYSDSASKIVEIVSNSIITLPKLDMLGSEVIASLITKVEKYSSFVNDYTQDIEKEGEALFDDLMDGYRVLRKSIFVFKNINSLTASQQTAYELINTVDRYLDEEGSEIYNYNTFKKSLDKQENILNNNSDILETLTSSIISSVSIDRASYSNDINNLLILRSQLKETTDVHLEVSSEIIDISEDIIASINGDTDASSDHGSDSVITQEECKIGKGIWDEKTLTCSCEDSKLAWSDGDKACVPIELLIEECKIGKGIWDEKTLTCSCEDSKLAWSDGDKACVPIELLIEECGVGGGILDPKTLICTCKDSALVWNSITKKCEK